MLIKLVLLDWLQDLTMMTVEYVFLSSFWPYQLKLLIISSKFIVISKFFSSSFGTIWKYFPPSFGLNCYFPISFKHRSTHRLVSASLRGGLFLISILKFCKFYVQLKFCELFHVNSFNRNVEKYLALYLILQGSSMFCYTTQQLVFLIDLGSQFFL